ncbi:ABC transporter permease [Candidatus Oleimmundimicrobium sp.]|uniref:ABC transporter permease n=1 Tax=Candidatus Oleimmundimicrobium sp. TaxID=3060597 RepID=UPI00272322FB|nr:ABC transporter permease [Candidatus Oleimmundimicrobium sp.]MDO8885960.1 ABC transporter permease [Candidatus Oleimmundimicrobium sp.]
MIRAFLVAVREVRSYLQDKADLAFSLLLPIIIFALMYGAFGGLTMFHGTAHIVNEDEGGEYSKILLERLEELENLDIEYLSFSEADTKLKRSDLLMVFYIPEDFSDKLVSGEQAQLLFKQRGNGGQEGQIVASLIRGVAEEINQEFQVKKQVKNALANSDISKSQIETVTESFLEREREHPIVGVVKETVGDEPDPVNQFLPGIITMFVLFSITLTAQALVDERKKGTLERLLTTRLSVGELFTGKFLANVLRGFIQTFILLTLSYIVFQIFTPLSFIQALVLALIFSAAVSTLGLIIGSMARSPDQAIWIAVSITMAMVMLGGTFFEIPEASKLYALSKISINTYANDAFKTIIAQGGSLSDIGLELSVMGGVIVVGLILSRILFKAMPEGR